MNRYQEVSQILDTIRNAVTHINESTAVNNPELYLNLRDAIMGVNLEVFDSEVIKFNNIEDWMGQYKQHPYVDIVNNCLRWADFIEEILSNRNSKPNIIDVRFTKLMDCAKYVEYEDILKHSIALVSKYPEEYVDRLKNYYHSQSLYKQYDPDNKIYTVFEDRIGQFTEHRDDFIWLYERLGDYRSKHVLCSVLESWLTMNPKYLFNMKENSFPEYFDLDLVRCDNKEVIADLGAFTGDTILDYIDTYDKYKKIYCYEVTPETFQELNNNLGSFDNIVFRNKGVSNMSGTMYLNYSIGGASCNSIGSDSGVQIDTVTLDEDIQDKITLIKMDIEGAECQAIEGSVKHIINDRPKLLISVYHHSEDYWKIARLISSIRDDYTYYLRSAGEQVGPAEITLYAL